MSQIHEVFEFIKARKKWYLFPLVVLIIVLSSIIVLSEGSVVAPFIYAIF